MSKIKIAPGKWEESIYPNGLHLIHAGIGLRILRVAIKLLSNRRLNLAEEKSDGE